MGIGRKEVVSGVGERVEMTWFCERPKGDSREFF